MKATLKELRTAKGFTQKQLSERTGIPFRTIQELEADKIMHLSNVRADYLFRLAKELGEDMEKLSGCAVYKVMQGSYSKSGNGDAECVGRFYTLEDARKKFEEIKDDASGWARSSGYVETTIEIDNDDEDETYPVVDIIDSYSFEL